MKPRKVLMLVCICFAWAVANATSIAGPNSSPASTQVAQAHANFTYKGKSVHPMMVHELVSPIYGGHLVCVLNLDENASTNRFPEAMRERPNGIISCNQSLPNDRLGYFGYRYLGTLRGGTHVVVTYEGWGGTGVFEELLFVRFRVEKVRGMDGVVHERELMELIDGFGLGDRDSGEIRLMEDRVIVGTSKERKVAVVLQEPHILTEQ